MAINLPHVRQSIVGGDGIATQPWYAWFGRIQSALNAGTISDDQAAAAIALIATALGSPDGTAANIPPLNFLPKTTYVTNGDGIGVTGSLAGGGVEVFLDAVLADLNDVAVTAPSIGEALVWDGAEWAPGVVSGSGFEMSLSGGTIGTTYDDEITGELTHADTYNAGTIA